MQEKPKKLVLLNVSPTISHSVMEEFLTEELKLPSKMIILRVYLEDEVYGHR